MTASSISVWTIPNGAKYPLGISKRPVMKIGWAGGSAPFDVTHEWDTVSTFDSADYMSDVNTGVSANTDEGVPPSDMDEGTWHYRATVVDPSDDQNEVQKVSFISEEAITPTAIASHTYSGYPASNAVDGDTATYWWSGQICNGYTIQVDFDFGSAVTLSQMRMLQGNAHSGDIADSVKVYYSDDGSGYTLVDTFSSLGAGWSTLAFTAASHRYWRIEENSTRNSWWEIQEVEFFGPTSGGTWRLSYNSNATDDLEYDVPLTASVKEVQSVKNDATGGTFTLTFDGQTTGNIAYNAAASAVETALELLSSITAASVTGTGDDGTDEVQSLYNDATGGTFDLTFDGQTASTLAWNISAANLETALEGLSNVTAVSVTGAGTSGDPWIVTFEDPGKQNVAEMTADDTNLTGGSTGSTIATDTAGVSPDPWLITFDDPLGNVATMTKSDANLTGHTTGTTIAVVTSGSISMKDALEALTGITTVSVTGTAGSVYNIEFTNPALTDMLLLVEDDNSLTPTASIVITETTKGTDADVVAPTYPSAGTYDIINIESRDTPQFLELYKNVVPAFNRGGIEDRIEQPRFLHLYKNVTTDQPCPWLQKIAPTLTLQNSAIKLYGDSFGATQATYAAEVRLYANQDLSGGYTTLSAGSWSDHEVSATVPSGASSGWIVIMHTNGSETCFSSEAKLLQVEQVAADPDAGWWLKTVNRFNVADVEHTILPGNNVKSAFRKIMNSIGSGQVQLPLGDPAINDFVDPVTRKGVLVQTHLDKRMRYGWFAETMNHDYDEEGNAIVTIAGRGMEVVALWNKILPHDYPASPTKNPTWVYGSTENFVQNPGFDDVVDNPILSNPGGEDGNDTDGNAEGWSKRGDNVISYTAIQDSNNAMEDDWYIEVEASDNHSGVQQSVSVTPNRVYHVRTYVKDPLASGMRVTLALGGADDIASTGTYANNFGWNNEILAELDNVARNAESNGLPGGSTDGSWQVMDVEVQTGDEQTSLTISIQNDHHKTGIFNPFWIDHTEIEGWGLGLDPWKAYQPSHHASDSFRLQSTKTYDGSAYGLYLDPVSTWAGIEQIMPVNPLTKYTMSLWIWTDRANADDTFKLEAHKNDGQDTWIGVADEKIPNDESWTQYQVIFTTDDTTEELILRFVYSGPNNPNPAYVDSVSVIPGEPPSLAGVILNNILDKMADYNKLTYLERTFTDTLDSRGQAWPAALSLDIEPSESLYGLLGRLVALGHEWEIVPGAFAEGGDTGFELNVFTARSFSPDSGVGTRWTNDPEGPVIMPGDATIGGRVLKSVFNVNTVMAIGDDGVWSRVTQHPWEDADMDASDPADHGYKDSFGSIEDVISVSAGDATTIAQFAEARLADEKDRERAIQITMQRSAVIRPFIDISVGDTLYVDMPPSDPDPPIPDGEGGFTRRYPKRIRSIQSDLAGEGSEITFQIDIDRVIYEDELAWYAMIAQLSERSPSENSGQGTGAVSGAGGAVSVITGGAASGEVGPHTHSLKSTEIKDKALLGDVSGTLPGPVVVNALKGRPVSSTIPTPTDPEDPLDVVMAFDRDTNTWTPVEFEGGGGGSASGGGGGMTLIEEIEVTADVANVTFENIAATYIGLKAVLTLKSDRSADWEDVYVRMGNGGVDSGSTDYAQESRYGGSSTLSSTGSAQVNMNSAASGGNASSNELGHTIVEIGAQYADAAPTPFSFNGGHANGAETVGMDGVGQHKNSVVVNTIRFEPASASFKWTQGKVQLWGYVDDAATLPLANTWLGALFTRPSDETVHADDQEFDAALSGNTELLVSGNTTWTQGRGLLSAKFSAISTNDRNAQLWPLTPTALPITIETAVRHFGKYQNSDVIGVCLSDGAVAASNHAIAVAYRYSGGLYIEKGEGTFTTHSSSASQQVQEYGDSLVYMRIIWSAANTFKVQFSTDGVSWSDFGLGTIAQTMTPTHFGVAVTTWGASGEGIASFEYLRVTESDLSV